MGRRNIVEGLVRYLIPAHAGGMLLDIGCGTGGNIGQFVRDYTCVGIDVSPDAIGLARTLHPAVQFICTEDVLTSARELSSNTIMFLLLDVLEHIGNDEEFLSKLVECMGKNSYLLFTVPADMTLWSPHDVNHGHHRRYEYGPLMKCLSSLPLRIMMISHFNTILYPFVKAVRLVTNIRGKPWGAAGTDLSQPSWMFNYLLTKVFSTELWFLIMHLKHGRNPGWRKGVSLLGIVQRI